MFGHERLGGERLGERLGPRLPGVLTQFPYTKSHARYNKYQPIKHQLSTFNLSDMWGKNRTKFTSVVCWRMPCSIACGGVTHPLDLSAPVSHPNKMRFCCSALRLCPAPACALHLCTCCRMQIDRWTILPTASLQSQRGVHAPYAIFACRVSVEYMCHLTKLAQCLNFPRRLFSSFCDVGVFQAVSCLQGVFFPYKYRKILRMLFQLMGYGAIMGA